MNRPLMSEMQAFDQEQIRDLLLRYRVDNWKGIQPREIQDKIVEDLMRCDADGVLKKIAPFLRLSADSRLLDLGSGVGSFVVACRSKGLQCFGIEPDRIGNGTELSAIQIARRRVAEPVFVAAVGESLPFPDDTFDLVTMNQVIEHVSDQPAVVSEAARVLKSGGAVYIACPNYLRFYEPHYKMFWLPLMPKALGRLYLRLRGRRPVVLDQITYTTNHRLRKLFPKLGPSYEAFDLHREHFLAKREKAAFTASSTRFVSRLTYVPIAGSLLLKCILWYASITNAGCEWLVVKRASTD